MPNVTLEAIQNYFRKEHKLNGSTDFTDYSHSLIHCGSIKYCVPHTYVLRAVYQTGVFHDPIVGHYLPEIARSILPELDTPDTRIAFCDSYWIRQHTNLAYGYIQRLLEVTFGYPDEAKYILVTVPGRKSSGESDRSEPPYADKLQSHKWHSVAYVPADGSDVPPDYHLFDLKHVKHICTDYWLFQIGDCPTTQSHSPEEIEQCAEQRRQIGMKYFTEAKNTDIVADYPSPVVEPRKKHSSVTFIPQPSTPTIHRAFRQHRHARNRARK